MSNEKKNEQLPAFSPLPEDQDIVNEIRSEVDRLRQDGPEMASRVISELEADDLDTMEQVMPVRSVSEVRPVAPPAPEQPEIPTKTKPSPEIPDAPLPQQEIPAPPAPSPEVTSYDEEDDMAYADYDDPYMAYEPEEDDRKKKKKEKKARKKRKKDQSIEDEMENDIYYGVRIRSFEEIKREMQEKGPQVSEPTSKFTHLFDDTVEIPKGILNEVNALDTNELKRKREERAQMAMEEALADTVLADETIESEQEFHEETIAPEFGHRQAAPTSDDRSIIIDGFDYTEWKRTTQQIPIITDEMLEAHKKATYVEDEDSTLPVSVGDSGETNTLPIGVGNHADKQTEQTMMELELLMEQALAPTEESSMDEPVTDESVMETPADEAEEEVISEAEFEMEHHSIAESKEPETEDTAEELVSQEEFEAESRPETPVIAEKPATAAPTPEETVVEEPTVETPTPVMETGPDVEESIRAKVLAAMAEKAEEPVKKTPVVKPITPPHFTPVTDPERYRFHQIPIRTFRLDDINTLIAGELEMYRDPTIPPRTEDPVQQEEEAVPQTEPQVSSYGEVISLSTAGGIEAAISAAIEQADRFEELEAAEKEAMRKAAEEEAARKAKEEARRQAELEAAQAESVRQRSEKQTPPALAEDAVTEPKTAIEEVAAEPAAEQEAVLETAPARAAETPAEPAAEQEVIPEEESPVVIEKAPAPVMETEPAQELDELPDELKDLVETMEETVAEETAAIEEAEAAAEAERKAAEEAARKAEEEARAAEEAEKAKAETETKAAAKEKEAADSAEKAEATEENAGSKEQSTTETAEDTQAKTEEAASDENKPSEIFNKIASFPKPARKDDELAQSAYAPMMVPPALEELPAEDFEGVDEPKKQKRSFLHKKKGVTAEPLNRNEEPADEYTPKSDPKKISKELQTATKELQIRTFVTGFFTAALLALGLIYEKFIPDSVTAMPYLIMNLAFIVAPAAVCCKTIWNGVKALFSLQGNTDSGIAIAVLASIAQGIALFFSPELLMSGSVHVYGAVTVGALLVNTIGKLSMMNRIARNFIFVTSADKKCSVEVYEDINTAIQLAKGCVSEAPKIAYQRKVKFFKNFLNHSYASDPSMRTSQLIAPIALVASVVLGVVTAIITNNIIVGITALSVATCISAPIASLLCVNLPVAKLCKLARRHGAMLIGYEAVEKLSHTNAVMLDSTDLFPKDSVSLADIKLYGGKKTERSILNAAAVMSNIGGTLRDLFEGVITSQKEMLPMATDIAYIEEQGMTGMVGGKKILVGNRTMMYLNDVNMPADATPPMLAANQSVLYLAEDGELMAMLIVTYDPDHNTVHEMQRLEHCGIAAIVRTLDPNLTPEFLSTLFLVQENAIKVLPAELGKVCDDALQVVTDECDALMATRGKSFSMMRMLSACVRQKHNISLSVTMQIVSVIVGFVLVAFLSCYAGLQQLSTLAILIYEAFWLAAIIIIPKLRKP